jgi:hypothetical protein
LPRWLSTPLFGGNIMFEILGLLLRFPVFIAGILLWIIIGIPLWMLLTLLFVILLPFQLIAAAWNNDKQEWEGLVEHVKERLLFKGWIEALGDIYRWFLGYR